MELISPGLAASSPAILVEGLGKAYHVYVRPEDRLKQALSFGRGHYYREFWALREVSVAIAAGETVGIVGRNGSGKSTFLQLVSGVLAPTTGRVATHGRVVALLELGSGFNPDFTGRENVFLTAAILGLSRAETEARFDAIAAFAEIGDFIEQPVKHYSSGMYARLAFAVAAHVDADILIVDEILAVGDAAFSQKCMRFMRAFKERGTLLFVSHDAGAVIGLCDRALWLDQGRLRAQGPAKEVSRLYATEAHGEVIGRNLQTGGRPPAEAGRKAPNDALLADLPVEAAPGSGLGAVSLTDEAGLPQPACKGGEALVLRVAGQLGDGAPDGRVVVALKDRLGQLLFGKEARLAPFLDAEGRFRLRFDFALPMLRAGTFAVDVALVAGGRLRDRRHEAAILRVDPDAVTHGLVPWDVEVAYRIGDRR